jgi:tetratricopeptide (TPR) repeat protein
MEARQPDKAIEIFEELLEVAEEQLEVLISLANLRLAEGNYRAATSALKSFQRLEPGDPIGYRLMGRALMLDGHADEAILHFQRALDLNPESFVPFIRMAWIFATHPDRGRRRPAEAVHLAETAAEPTAYRNVEVLNTLAAAYASAGRFERAVDVAQSAVDFFDANFGISLYSLRLHLRACRNGQSLFGSIPVAGTLSRCCVET